jgi:hypothetical protein
MRANSAVELRIVRAVLRLREAGIARGALIWVI